jgi:hypothetical protein
MIGKVANTACTRLVGVCAFSSSFAWLEVNSAKIALSHPAHQRVTQTVGCLGNFNKKEAL